MTDLKDMREHVGAYDDTTLQALAWGIEDARQYHYLDSIYAPRGTFKELKIELDQLAKCLFKMASSKGNPAQPIKRLQTILWGPSTISKDQWRWLDHFYLSENSRDEFYMHAFEVNPGQSRFEKMAAQLPGYDMQDRTRLAGRMLSAVDAMRTELRGPGHGGAKRQARRKIPKIHILARHFEEATSKRPTSSPSGPFWRYVRYATGIDDPRRHIENALI
ncbi:MAG: hypothetical protein LC676_06235 [Loktanella sp.]|nr:hypothetical protein [Loktanella sp.]